MVVVYFQILLFSQSPSCSPLSSTLSTLIVFFMYGDHAILYVISILFHNILFQILSSLLRCKHIIQPISTVLLLSLIIVLSGNFLLLRVIFCMTPCNDLVAFSPLLFLSQYFSVPFDVVKESEYLNGLHFVYFQICYFYSDIGTYIFYWGRFVIPFV